MCSDYPHNLIHLFLSSSISCKILESSTDWLVCWRLSPPSSCCGLLRFLLFRLDPFLLLFRLFFLFFFFLLRFFLFLDRWSVRFSSVPWGDDSTSSWAPRGVSVAPDNTTFGWVGSTESRLSSLTLITTPPLLSVFSCTSVDGYWLSRMGVSVVWVLLVASTSRVFVRMLEDVSSCLVLMVNRATFDTGLPGENGSLNKRIILCVDIYFL